MTLSWIRPWLVLILLYPIFFILNTFVLLWVRGLPSFATLFPLITFDWVVSVTWIPGLLASLFLTAIVVKLRPYLYYFTQPYDFGRSFSLGAITGAIVQALATGLYRTLAHRPFSDFWIAGAMIAGCIAGALATAIFFWHWSVQKPVIPKPLR